MNDKLHHEATRKMSINKSFDSPAVFNLLLGR